MSTEIANPFGPSSLPPDSICGYTVLRTLGTRSYLALAEGGRQAVLKPLDPDCLLQGQLHPSIKERLSRIRELALKSGTNLYGVERDERGVFLIWEYVDGLPLSEATTDLSIEQLTLLAREIVLAVEATHALGIIHGKLHARNIIIDTAGRPRLTHVSPLLYHDPLVDETAVIAVLAELTKRPEVRDSQLGRIAAGAVPGKTSLRQLASSLVTLVAATRDGLATRAEDDRYRRRTLIKALIVALCGVFLAVGAYVLARTILTSHPDDEAPIAKKSP